MHLLNETEDWEFISGPIIVPTQQIKKAVPAANTMQLHSQIPTCSECDRSPMACPPLEVVHSYQSQYRNQCSGLRCRRSVLPLIRVLALLLTDFRGLGPRAFHSPYLVANGHASPQREDNRLE